MHGYTNASKDRKYQRALKIKAVIKTAFMFNLMFIEYF